MKDFLTNNKFHGYLQIILATYWIWEKGSILHSQSLDHIDFFYRYPEWYLISNIVLGTLGIIMGAFTLMGKLKFYSGYWILLFAICLYVALTVMDVM